MFIPVRKRKREILEESESMDEEDYKELTGKRDSSQSFTMDLPLDDAGTRDRSVGWFFKPFKFSVCSTCFRECR